MVVNGFRGGLVSILALSSLVLLLGCQAQSASPAATSVAAPKAAAPAPPATSAAPAAPAPTAAAKPAAAPTAAPETLKVGIMVPLSGAGARSGMNVDRFIRFAIDDLNAQGGVKVGGKTYRLEGITVDNKSTSDGGREAANRLVLADKVRFILGSNSAPAAGAQAITEPNKVVMLTNATTDKSLGTEFPYTLQVAISHNMVRTKVIYEWLAKDHPEVKRVSAVMTDDSTGRAMADVTEATAKAKGLTFTGKEFFPIDLKDFGPLVARVLRANPDGIDTVAGARGPLFLDLMKVLTQQEYKGQVFGASADIGALRDGAAVIRNYTTAVLADWKSPLVGSREKEIIERAISKYGEAEVEAFQVANYNIPLVLAQVLEKAGTIEDGDKLIKELRANEWDTIWSQKWGKSRFVGAKTFGLPAVLEQPIYLTEVQQGKMSTTAVLKETLP